MPSDTVATHSNPDPLRHVRIADVTRRRLADRPRTRLPVPEVPLVARHPLAIEPVVNEEVRVGKRAVQNTENVSDNVRHEELRVDKSGDVNVDPEIAKTGKRKKPAA